MKLRTRKKRLARFASEMVRDEKRRLGWHWPPVPRFAREQALAWLRDPDSQTATLYSWLGVIACPEDLQPARERFGTQELLQRALSEMRPRKLKNVRRWGRSRRRRRAP